jgi:hypothetical protein
MRMLSGVLRGERPAVDARTALAVGAGDRAKPVMDAYV